MTYKVQGINKVFWKIAKSNDEITLDLLKEKIAEYSGNDKVSVSDYTVYDLLLFCVGDAIAAGVIKAFMFRDAMKQVIPNPVWDGLINDNRDTSTRLLHALFSMMRFTQVQTVEGEVLIDFGQDDEIE